MKDVLRLEFRKLKRQKSFYICTGIMLALLLLSAISCNMTNSLYEDIMNSTLMDDAMGEGFATEYYSLYTVIDMLISAVSSGTLVLLAAIFVSIAVCDDYSQHTIKNIYARGYTRTQVFFAKAIYVLVTASAMFIVALLFSFLTGLIFFDMGSADGGKLAVLLIAQYVAFLANVSIFFLISILFRRIGASVAVNIVGSTVVSLILSLIDLLIMFKTENYEDSFSVSEYWVDSFIGDLSALTVDNSRIISCVVASAVYIALVLLIGWRFHRKTEVK